MKLKKIAITIFFGSISFLIGAIWVKTKMFPYQYLAGLEQVTQLSKKVSETPKLPNFLDTAFSQLNVKAIKLDATFPLEHNGGGMVAIGNQAIIVSKRGRFFWYNSGDSAANINELDISLNINYQEFLNFVKTQALDDKIVRDWFRFIDIIYRENNNGGSLLMSHYFWHPEKQCFTVRISSLELPSIQQLETVSKLNNDWKTIYDTTPCLKLKNKGFYFAGHFSGGRMELLNDNELLFTVGFLGYDGLASDVIYSQGTGGNYGKILKLDLQTDEVSDFSIGHRNPQGLTIDRKGNIWSTEHGPKGGDELNLIGQDTNYGWPNVTYGVDYGSTSWPLSEAPGRHDGYRRPVFSWVPSIGISNLIEVQGFLPEWDGDLLVASLKQQTLFRVRYVEDRAVFVEPINIGVRNRDIDQFDNGNIVLWSDETWLIELTPAEDFITPDIDDLTVGLVATDKQQAISAIHSCEMCHSVTPDGNNTAAPNLWAVYDRKISGSSFERYSSALRAKQGNWDEQNLNSWLKDSNGFANGTSMVYPGISNPKVRQVVIDYIKALQ
jgi:cytochrome c2